MIPAKLAIKKGAPVRRKTKIRIKLATHKDAERFLKLEATCFKMKCNPDTVYFWTPVVSYLWAYKAELNGKLVGGIIAMPTRNGYWYINSLFVHPRYRKHGIATRLLSKVLKLAGKSKMLLDVKTDRIFLLNFYHKHGFATKKLIKNYYHDGTDRYLLVKLPKGR